MNANSIGKHEIRNSNKEYKHEIQILSCPEERNPNQEHQHEIQNSQRSETTAEFRASTSDFVSSPSLVLRISELVIPSDFGFRVSCFPFCRRGVHTC
jgi:hypothetical protein